MKKKQKYLNLVHLCKKIMQILLNIIYLPNFYETKINKNVSIIKIFK